MGYYFISVGGSGARVLEALTHLCTAGLFPNLEREGTCFHAMAIDPDTRNGNLKRTQTLLNNLQVFQNINVGKETPLLKTKLKIIDSFIWSPTPTGQDLDDIISYHDFQNQLIGRLYESLYTENERRTILDEGFRGRPSIGAAVMSRQAMSHDHLAAKVWHSLIKTVNSDIRTNESAKIFLAGSIFGGTGAAGLPTIARLLDDAFKENRANGKVRIGGALLLPYFSFSPTQEQKETSGIFASSDNFLTNTKAALQYYSDPSGRGYDSMYFIGDETMAPMSVFSVGAGTQCNDAHIVDFFAAMAALHFYQQGTHRPCYYISRNQDNAFQWSDVPNVTMDNKDVVSVKKRFVRFTRFIFSYLYHVKPVFENLEKSMGDKTKYPWYADYLQNKVKVTDDDVRNFEEYAESFVNWLNQVEHSAGARSVEMINPKSFIIDNNYSKINMKLFKDDKEFFKTLDYDNSNITIEDIITRLNSKPGLLEKLLSFRRQTNQDLGENFGFLLRKLYDSCAVGK